MLWGPPFAPFVSLLGNFTASLEHLGQSWGTLWDTWVSIGTALEILRPPETPSQAEGSQVPRLCPPLPTETLNKPKLRTYLPHAPGIQMT